MTAENLFRTVFEMQPRDTGSSGGQTVTREEKVLLCTSLQIYYDTCLTRRIYLVGEASTGRNNREATRRVQHDGDHGKSGGTDTLCDRRLSGMRENEFLDDRDQTIAAGVRSGPQRRTHYNVGYGGLRKRVVLRSSSASVGQQSLSILIGPYRLVRRSAAEDQRAGNMVYGFRCVYTRKYTTTRSYDRAKVTCKIINSLSVTGIGVARRVF